MNIVTSEQVAMNWHVAEQGTGPWSELPEEQRETIKERVRLVLEGEVRVSEMSTGDRAVYFGRQRILEKEPPPRFQRYLQDLLPVGAKTPKMWRETWWDCTDFKSRSVTLLDNPRIGELNLCNLQSPLSGGTIRPVWISGWHLRIESGSTTLPLLEENFANATATLVIGDHPVTTQHLINLWHEPRLIGKIVPERESLCVRVSFLSKHFEDLSRITAFGPLRMWIMLETWQAHRCD